MATGPTHQRVDTRAQFFWVKRFGQVVVCPRFQSRDLVLPCAAGGQNQNWVVALCGAQLPNTVLTVHQRQAHIDNGQVILVLPPPTQSFAAVSGQAAGIVVGAPQGMYLPPE